MPSPVPTPVAAAIGLVPTLFGGVRRLPGRAVRLPVHAVGHVLTTVGSAKREYDALAADGEALISKLRGTSFDEVEDAVEDALQDTPFAKPYDVVEDALEDAGEAVTQLVRSGRDAVKGVADAATQTTEQAVDVVSGRAATATRAAGQAAEAVADGAAAVADAVQPEDEAAQEAEDSSDEPPATGPLEVEAAVLAGLELPAGSPLADLGTETAGGASEVPEAEAPKGVPTPKATEPDSTRIDTVKVKLNPE